jgi:hypothetical protein
MEAGKRRWVPDPPTFNCMGLNWGAIQTISDSEWSQIPKGVPYPSRAAGTLLQGSGPQVYVMSACQRHLFPDPYTFNAYAYDWGAIQHVSDADLSAIAEGAPMQPPQSVVTPVVTPTVTQQPVDSVTMLSQMQQQAAVLQKQVADQMALTTSPQSTEALLEYQQMMTAYSQAAQLLSSSLAQSANLMQQISQKL